MKVETERLGNCQMALTIEVDEERTQRALRDAARRISRQVKIPGFRPGKAPYHVIARYFGKEILYQEVVDGLGEPLYREALKEVGLEPFRPATLTDYEIEPLVLKLVVPLAPVIELGDYRQIRLEPEAEAIEEEIDGTLKRIQQENVFWQSVKRSAQQGDMAVVDIKGMVGEKTVIENEGRKLILGDDSSEPLPGFSEKLLGMSPGEERVFTLVYPEDFEDESLAGRQVHFRVYLQDLKEEVMPDIDDDLARTVGDYETLEDLKAELRRQLEAEAEDRFAYRALTALVERAEIEFPPVLLEEQIDDLLEEFDRDLRREGLNLENYLAMRKQTKEGFREEIAPQAEERLKLALVLNRFIELEGLENEPDATRKAMERLAAIAKGELEEETQSVETPPEKELEGTDQQVVDKE